MVDMTLNKTTNQPTLILNYLSMVNVSAFTLNFHLGVFVCDVVSSDFFNEIYKIHHIFKQPGDGLIKKPERLTLANVLIINKIIP